MSKTSYMRGLQNFIADIRSAQNKEQEQKRVEKELAKIRERFGDDKSLSGYDRRKYVWKLLYIYMLGYDIEFGHKQAADLIPQPKYKDKQVGYMACSLLLSENDGFLRLAINAIHMDLTSRNEAFECLALSFIGNVGGSEMAEALTQDVIKLLTSGVTRPVVKKRAALALLRLIRKTPPEQPVVSPDTFSTTINSLLEERDLGLLLSSVTLLHGICMRNGAAGYEGAQSRLIKILEKLTMHREREVPQEYLYYGTPSPWLQTKALRVLQFYQAPEDSADRARLNAILQKILETYGSSDIKNVNPNKANAMYSILFEAMALAIHLDTDRNMLTTCVRTLPTFLNNKEPNIKYLALENMARLASIPEVLEVVKQQKSNVIAALKDYDVSIRKRATDLLFTMCDTSNSQEIVGELLNYLTVADFSLREELVLKIAILAEKFAPSVQWYVDTMLQLMERAGDFVSEDIWHRVVQLVTNNQSMQQYAAQNIVEVLKRGAAHESLVCTSAYILGEFGRLTNVPAAEQFRLLHGLFPPASESTKGLLMTAFIKIYLLDAQNQNLRREVVGLYERYQKFMSTELQQRASEYLRLAGTPQAAVQHYLLPMPKWEERESTLLKRLQQHEGVEDTTAAAAAAAGSSSALTGDGAVQAAGAAPAAVPRLVLGGPMAAPQPSMDLLGSQPSGAFANGAAAQQPPQAPPRPSNPVDLLSDLLSDFTPMAAPTTAPPQAAPAPGTSAPAPFLGAAPGPMGAAPVFPGSTSAPMYPAQPAAMPGAQGQVAAFQATFPSSASVPTAAGAPVYGGPASAGFTGGAPHFPPAAMAAQQPGFPPAPAQQLPPSASFSANPLLAPSASFSANPFGGDPFGEAAFPGQAAPIPQYEPAKPTGDIQHWFNNLLVKDRGILYEDQYLQVGVQTQYARGSGQLVLFLGNKHADQGLQRLSLVAAPSPHLQAIVAPAPPQLAPKQQVQVPITLTPLAPFGAEATTLTLAYTLANVVVNQPLRLPVLGHKFIVPEPQIPKELFFEQWKLYGNPANKVQEMVERPTPVASPTIVNAARMANLGVEHGYLDPNPANEAGAGYFTWGMPGAEQRVLVMVRIEANPQTWSQFRVTVASPSPALAAQVKDLVVAQLKAAAA